MDNCTHSSLFSLHFFYSHVSRFWTLHRYPYGYECVMEQYNIIIALFYQQIIPASDWPGSRGVFFSSFHLILFVWKSYAWSHLKHWMHFLCNKLIDFLCSHCSIGHAELSLVCQWNWFSIFLFLFIFNFFFLRPIQLCAPCIHCELNCNYLFSWVDLWHWMPSIDTIGRLKDIVFR